MARSRSSHVRREPHALLELRYASRRRQGTGRPSGQKSHETTKLPRKLSQSRRPGRLPKRTLSAVPDKPRLQLFPPPTILRFRSPVDPGFLREI